ncbi:type II toxin-antitoxin system HipA family toxin [Antrihabitans spumae]|uniref:type II toxin-antitoxin system HipA family toxin n=1 Tax=Antrihabitans spumae TaxID=3373370 RepID=UPI003751F153
MTLSTSEAPTVPRDAFVWVWLPSHTDPVPAGRLQFQRHGRRYAFGYGRSYLERNDAISLYEPELPLRPGWQAAPSNMSIASALRDAGPDSWGQRVILERIHGVAGTDADTADLDQITYFLESGSNRIGGLDFQTSPEVYIPRGTSASLDDLHAAADTLDQGRELSDELGAALLRGTSIGGARPKALIDVQGRGHIVKFSSASDPYPVVNAEALALELARRAGIDTTASFLTKSLGRDVLAIERFDRPADGSRRIIVSALTMLGLDEMEGRYATYPDLLDVLRRTGTDPAIGRRLFERIVFNVAIGNNDDHARNHAAFWDGKALELTPAYDLCPQIRSGETSSQALAFDRKGTRNSSFAAVVAAAPVYGLTTTEAHEIIDAQVAVIEQDFTEVADMAKLTKAQRNFLWHRQILNPHASYGYAAGR